jgi:hypothetical protein
MSLSQAAIYQLVLDRGGTPAEAQNLSGIAMAESGGDPNAANKQDPYGGSFGLYQINGVHGLPMSQMTDPTAATDYALSLLRGQGLAPWKGDAYVQSLGGSQSLTNYGGANMIPTDTGTPPAGATKADAVYAGGTLIGWNVPIPGGTVDNGDGTTTTLPGKTQFVSAQTGANAHVPTPYGVSPPDALGGAAAIAKQYDQAIATGDFNLAQAKQAWDEQWAQITSNANIDTTNVSNKLSADTTNQNTGTQYMQAGQSRAANIASAQGNLNSEATQRASIVKALLASSLPGGQTLNVVGGAPGTPNAYLPQQVNVDQMLSQGLPSLQSQYGGLQSLFPTIGPAPTITAGTVAPVTAPASLLPTQLPPQPDISGLITQGALGSGPMGYY